MRLISVLLLLQYISCGAVDEAHPKVVSTPIAQLRSGLVDGPLVCDEPSYDFGELLAGDDLALHHEFAVTNTSDEDVWIEKDVCCALWLRPPTYYIPAGQAVLIPVDLKLRTWKDSFKVTVRLSCVSSPDSSTGVPVE